MIREIKLTEKQIELIKDPSLQVLIEGGIGAGKSFGILYKIGAICEFYPKSTWLIGRRTLKELESDTYQICFRTPGLWNGKGKMNYGKNIFDFTNGSRVFFTHFDDPASLKGPSVSGIYIEQAEGISEEVFDTLSGRLRQWGNVNEPGTEGWEYVQKYKNATNYGKIPKEYYILCANPAPCWIKDKFIDKNMPNWKVIHLKTEDNKFLNPDFIENLRKTKSDAWIKRYLDGSWDALAGAIYPEFTMNNVIDPIDANFFKDKNYKIICAIDPGFQHYTAVVWAALLPTGHIYVFDEVYEKEMLISDIIKKINEVNIYYGSNNMPIKPMYIIDYAANAHSLTDGKSVADIFRAHGIMPQNADKAVLPGIMRIKELFKSNKIKISSNCKNLTKELFAYCWDEKNPDKPIKKFDDAVDCLRYIINKEYRPNKAIYEQPSYSPDIRAQKYISSIFWESFKKPIDEDSWGL